MTFNCRIIFAFGLALLITLSGCGKKETPVSVEPTPVGPFTVAELADLNGAEEARVGVEYSVPDAAQKISFDKAYRTEFLSTGNDYYWNVVVLDASSISMEDAQAAMANRRTAYLADSMNRQYRFPEGYTLYHDPVTHKIYFVYKTEVNNFEPEFQYLVLGDFASGTGQKTNLFFDLGELTDYTDITPFTPTQEMPDEATLQKMSDALAAATADNADINKIVATIGGDDDNKLEMFVSVNNFESKEKAIENARALYVTGRSVFAEFGHRIDVFTSWFFFERSDEAACCVSNFEVYNDPWEFAYSEFDSYDAEFFDLLPRPGSGSRSNYSDITLTEFNKIQDGDSYSRVKKIVGGDGELLSTSTILDTTYESYTWYGADGISNAIIFFSNGAVYSKSQYGLS